MTKRTTQDESARAVVRPIEASHLSGLTAVQLARMADRGILTYSRPGGSHRRYVRAEIEALSHPIAPNDITR